MIKSSGQWVIEVNPVALRRRFFQIIPATLSWGTLIGLSVLAFIIPFWIAIFIIIYDLYALIRGVYMSVHLVYAYRRLGRERSVNWIKRCQGVSGDLTDYCQHLRARLTAAAGSLDEQAILRQHLTEVENLRQRGEEPLNWEKIHHVVILPTYDESLAVLRTSLASLAAVDYPQERLHVVIGFEERVGKPAQEKSAALQREFAAKFGTLLITFHPDGLPGEARVKSANATWALKHMEVELQRLGIPVAHILVSNFDSDTVVNPSYFSLLTYTFITHPDRYRVSYQPLPMYNNNLWDAPAFSRVIATGSTFWQMIESTRPERLVTFSSHSMTLRALQEVGYWQKNIVSEDSRIFWQCLLHYHGHYRTEPLYTTVSMDAALAGNWWQTLKNQYKQKRRWAWGIENFPYIAEGFLRQKQISFRTKFTYIFRTLEGHHSWATAPIIIAGLGWLPIFFGGPEFHATVLSYSLPFVARTIVSIAMVGLLISTTLSLLLLPPRPQAYSRWRYLGIMLQWALVPLIAAVLSALPALDAETRLFLGRDLEFNVMQKSRRPHIALAKSKNI
ncbi:MAG: glycosyltransferase family 2 protein [Candidatus Andersenbacteria bacterium]